jgi:hypothetical protein
MRCSHVERQVFPDGPNRKRAAIFVALRRSPRDHQRGSETLAGVFAMMVLILFTIVLIDIGWGVFVKVTLQHAVREGVRYAITNRVADDGLGGSLGQLSSIREVVFRYAGSVLVGQEEKVTIKFFNPVNLVEDQSPYRNRGGNVVMVSVENYEYFPIIPIGRNNPWWRLEIGAYTPIVFTVHAADRMESCPMGVCSPL